MLFLIILILSFASGFIIPWWASAVIAFMAGALIGKTSLNSFFSGFFAIALVWLALALLKTIPNNNILAGRVAKLFTLPGWGYLLALTCLIGGLVGGLATLSGMLVKKAFSERE